MLNCCVKELQVKHLNCRIPSLPPNFSLYWDLLLTGAEYMVLMFPLNFSVASKNKHSTPDFWERKSLI